MLSGWLGTILQFKINVKFSIFFTTKENIMNKSKFHIDKALKAVIISSKIEGHKIPRIKTNNAKRAKSTAKS
ncbi:MAG: hypothetical protein FD143_3237 [Ignavibacteria bacterium]|nr:MAG: hypothetical protein FD143_3237 [Ignavibacteria bacterium]